MISSDITKSSPATQVETTSKLNENQLLAEMNSESLEIYKEFDFANASLFKVMKSLEKFKFSSGISNLEVKPVVYLKNGEVYQG